MAVVDQRPRRLRGGDVTAGDHLHQRGRHRARVGLCGEVRTEVVGHGAAVRPERGQEHRLRLAHDVAGDARHHVVEASVGEVVLDPGPACPRQRAVDHVQLAVLGAPELVLAPIEVAVDEQPVEVELDRVVGDDLGAGAHEVAVHVLVGAVGIGPLVVDCDPHLDTLGELLLQDAGELRADLTGVPSEHQDVDRLGGALDVLDDARVELGPLRPRFDRRRRGPRVVEIEVSAVWESRSRNLRWQPAHHRR